jgi:hypothetical protein
VAVVLAVAAGVLALASTTGLVSPAALHRPGADALLVAGFVTVTVSVGAVVLTLDLIAEPSRRDRQGATVPDTGESPVGAEPTHSRPDTGFPEPAAAPPESETVPAVPRVGAEIDGIVDGPYLPRRRSAAERDQVRERLRRTAVGTVRRERGVSTRRAESLVDRGEWTADATAAAFLGDREPRWPLGVAARVVPATVFRYRVRRTVRAVVTVANGEGEA